MINDIDADMRRLRDLLVRVVDKVRGIDLMLADPPNDLLADIEKALDEIE